jgi:hypothetical protein
MSKPLRDRRNRRDTAVRGTDALCGAMVSATEYCTGSVMVEVHAAVPPTAAMAGRYDDRLLPGPE